MRFALPSVASGDQADRLFLMPKTAAKCDPDYGWVQGPGGKCVRKKPSKRKNLAVIAGGGGLLVGAGVAIGATALLRRSSDSKKAVSQSFGAAEANRKAAQQVNQSLSGLEAAVAKTQQRLLPAAKGNAIDLPPDRESESLKKAGTENERLRGVESQLTQERDRLGQQLSAVDREIKSHRQSLQQSQEQLSKLESAHSRQVEENSRLREVIGRQEQALQSLSKDLESQSQSLEQGTERLRALDQERLQADRLRQAATRKTDRLKSQKDDVDADLQSTRNLLKRAEGELADARSQLEQSQQSLEKTRQELTQARDRAKRIEDALLVVPVLKPGLRGNMGRRKSIDPATLDLSQKPDKDRRRRSIALSLENAQLQLAALRKQGQKQEESAKRRQAIGRILKRKAVEKIKDLGRGDSLRLDRQRAKCDPDHGWEQGPGGKCVRKKPTDRQVIAASAGAGLAVGAGIVLGAAALQRQSNRLESDSRQSAQRVAQAAQVVGAASPEGSPVKTQAIASQRQQKANVEQAIQSLQPASKDPIEIAPRSISREIEAENQILRKVQSDLIKQRDDLGRQLSGAEQSLAQQQQSLQRSRQELDRAESLLFQEAATTQKLSRTLSDQEKALQSLAQDLERRSAALAQQQQSESAAIKSRDQAIARQQSAVAANDKIVADTEAAKSELFSARQSLKESQAALKRTRQTLDRTAQEIAKVGEQHQKALGRVTELEDALLPNPIQRPGYQSKKRLRQPIDPATLSPDSRGKREQAIEESLRNADRHLAKLRGEPDPERRRILQAPVDYAKQQVGELDPDRVRTVASAGAAAKAKFQESMARGVEPVAPSNSEEAKRTLEKIAEGHLKEVPKKAIPAWIELAIPGPNGKRAADLYRFAMADQGMAAKVERWSKEMEGAMQNPDPISRRQWMERFRNKVFEETLSSRSNIEKTTGTIDEIGEVFTDLRTGGRIGGEKIWTDRTNPDNPFAAWRSRVRPGQKVVPRSFSERISRLGFGGKYKRLADTKKRQSLLARFIRDLMIRKDSDDPVSPSTLARLLRIDSDSSRQILSGQRTLNAREIGYLRAQYQLPPIFDPDCPLSTQILLSGIRQDARKCKTPWEGVLGKCRRSKEEDTEPPGRKAAKATLLAGAAVGLGLAGLGAYAASRPMPPRPAPPDISPGRPRPTPPPPPKAGKKPPTPPPTPSNGGSRTPSDYDEYAPLFTNASGEPRKSVLGQAWARVTGRGGTSSPDNVLQAAILTKENKSTVWDRYRAYTIADNLDPSILRDAFEHRKELSEEGKMKRPYDGKTLFALSAIGNNSNLGQPELQRELWNRLKLRRTPHEVSSDYLLGIAKEARFASETSSGKFKMDDEFIGRAERRAAADYAVTRALRTFSSASNSPTVTFQQQVEGIQNLRNYPFLRVQDYQGPSTSRSGAAGAKLTQDAFQALQTWGKMQYDQQDEYHQLLRGNEGLLSPFEMADAKSSKKILDSRESALTQAATELVRMRLEGVPYSEARKFVDGFLGIRRTDSQAECDPDHGWKDGPGKCVRSKKPTPAEQILQKAKTREWIRQRRASMQPVIDREEQRIANLPHEETLLLGLRGAGIRLRGDSSSVKLDLSLEQRKALVGGVATHNHPSGCAFSLGDFRTACRLGLSEVRAVTADHVHILRRKDGKAGFDLQDLKQKEAFIETQLRAGSATAAGLHALGNSPAVAQVKRDMFHGAWVRIGKQFPDLEYRREERKK